MCGQKEVEDKKSHRISVGKSGGQDNETAGTVRVTHCFASFPRKTS
jgi:hypothetical protein